MKCWSGHWANKAEHYTGNISNCMISMMQLGYNEIIWILQMALFVEHSKGKWSNASFMSLWVKEYVSKIIIKYINSHYTELTENIIYIWCFTCTDFVANGIVLLDSVCFPVGNILQWLTVWGLNKFCWWLIFFNVILTTILLNCALKSLR